MELLEIEEFVNNNGYRIQFQPMHLEDTGIPSENLIELWTTGKYLSEITKIFEQLIALKHIGYDNRKGIFKIWFSEEMLQARKSIK